MESRYEEQVSLRLRMSNSCSDSANVDDFRPGMAFWMVYVSNLVVDMLSALDLVRLTHRVSKCSLGVLKRARFPDSNLYRASHHR